MNYYSLPQVSNSDLSSFKRQIYPKDFIDPTEAYKFGRLIDCMITEPEQVDYLNLTCGEDIHSRENFDIAKTMKRAFFNDQFCKELHAKSEAQRVMIVDEQLFDHTTPFTLPVRCKWDLWAPVLGWGGDIKSTTATTQKQFVEACRYFDYDRQRFFYMNIAGSNRDVLIGISKVNFQVFKLPIVRGDDFWKSGRSKTMDLAFKYWLMFYSHAA